MLQWQREFLAQLKMGTPADKAARSAAGRSLREVLDAKDADPTFSNAWDIISEPDGGRGKSISRTLTGQSLEALLWSQCDDEEAAAYFNMDVDEMLAAIAADPELERIHMHARAGGRAQVKVVQMNEASAGNGQMAIWLGKQHLGQSDKAESRVVHDVAELDNYELARRILFVLEQNKLKENPFLTTVDAVSVEIQDAPPVKFPLSIPSDVDED